MLFYQKIEKERRYSTLQKIWTIQSVRLFRAIIANQKGVQI